MIPLRVVIQRSHSRRQIDLLSSHFKFQAHQVISLKISDDIFDKHTVISLFFRRHKFKKSDIMFIHLYPFIEQTSSCY